MCTAAHTEADPGPGNTHVLLPGIRSEELNRPDWPRTLHDKQLTGFTPLTCGMTRAPRVWATVEVGGTLNWLKQVRAGDGRDLLLVNDGRTRLVTPDGEVLWTKPGGHRLAYFGRLRGGEHDYLLLTAGARLTLVDGATGETEWEHAFTPAHVYVRPAVGDVLPERPGLEAAVFQQYGTEGCLINFPPEGAPVVVWQKTVVVPGEHPERADHGCDIKLDLSVADQPVIWNVRHHRCRGFDARTGEMLSSLVYQLGGGHRRNYGPWAMGRGGDDEPVICVVGESIQQHVHGIRLRRDGPNELAWQHYYGEVYVTPGVAVKHIAVTDVDGDGATEVVYNVRDPAHGMRSFVRVRDVGTGKVEAELPDQVCAATFSHLGPDALTGLLARPAANAVGDLGNHLRVHRFTPAGSLEEIAKLPSAVPWGVAEDGDGLLILETDARGDRELARYTWRDGALRRGAGTRASALVTGVPKLALKSETGETTFLVTGAEGALQCVTWDGELRWQLPLTGGAAPRLSAADVRGNGRAELFVATPSHRVRQMAFDDSGGVQDLGHQEFYAGGNHAPLLYDLEGNGELSLVAPGRTTDEKVCVRAFRGGKELIWEAVLDDVPSTNGGMAVAWNVGEFLPGPRAGVAVSFADSQRTCEGTAMLDGLTGKVLWEKRLHKEGAIVRSYRPIGIPSAFDVDGDGKDEVCLDMSSYMAFLQGEDGDFAFLRHTANIRAQDSLYAAFLYNSYCPVYESATAAQPHWFVPLGYGRIGLMNPEPTTGVWREDVGYDTPPRVGLIDVDGDGILEAGYALRNSPVFQCRNLWTGEVKWTLELPSAPNSPVIVGDFDGDGKGEFLVGYYCIGTDDNGKGELRWRAPMSLGWAIVADFDGDGVGEIATGWGGKVYVLKAVPEED